MTNPAFHSWRLNWASLNPMFFLTQDRNKWGMAELCVCASLTFTLFHRNPASALWKFWLNWKKLYDSLKFLRFHQYCMFLPVIWLLDSELLEFHFLVVGELWVTFSQNPLIPQVTTPTIQTTPPSFHNKLQKLISVIDPPFLDRLLPLLGGEHQDNIYFGR